MMYKTIHEMTPEYLRSRFVSRDDITSYRLTNAENKLALPQSRTNYLKKSFSYSDLCCQTAYSIIYDLQRL